MRSRLVLVVLVWLIRAPAFGEEVPWYDHALHVTATSAVVVDYGTTYTRVGSPYCHEGNPLVPRTRAGVAVVGAVLSGVMVMAYVQTIRRDRPLRWWQRVILAANLGVHGGAGAWNLAQDCW